MQEIGNFQKQNSIENFSKSPLDLIYEKKLATDRTNTGLLKNIAIYAKNDIGYLVYQKMNFNLIVMRINNNNIIKFLIGHNADISFIRYYCNKNKLDNEEEYIYHVMIINWSLYGI